MSNFDDVTTKENLKEYNPNWLEIPDHPYRILIIGGSWSGKTNSLFGLINQLPDINKMYLYRKDPYVEKYKFLSNKKESTGLKHFKIRKLLLNTQMIWMMFIKILKNTIQIKIKNINCFWCYDCWYA